MVMHRAFGEMYNLKTIAGLLVRMSIHDPNNPRRMPRRRSNCPIPWICRRPRSDIWRQHHDLLAASQHICSEVFRLAECEDSFSEKEESPRLVATYI